jgi:UDP:flavonoid glycosyltransferase YjiC (YdhE family)
VRVAIVAGSDPGHAFPAIALCLRFAAAGDVPCLFTRDPWVHTAAREGIWAPRMTGLAQDDKADLGRGMHERSAALADALVPHLSAVAPDLVVADILASCGGMAAERLGVPWVELSPHPLYAPSKALPPIGSGLAPGTGVAGRLRDVVLRATTARSIRQGSRQRARARLGIGLSEDDPGPAARLIATIPALEVPRPDWPGNAHIVGPLLWEPTRESLIPPPGDGPLVVIAPSTASIGAVGMVEATLAGLHDTGVRAVLSMIAPPPREVPGWVRAGLGRQDELLRQASAVVCGGGHGLLSKALLAGVPVVAVPGAGDQWELANRAARLGSAVIVRPPSADAVREAVLRVLGNPRFAAAATAAAATASDVDDPVRVCRSVLASSGAGNTAPVEDQERI